MSTLLYLYIFTIGWTGAFALGLWFPLHVVLLLAAAGLFLPVFLTGKKFPGHLYHFEDVFPYLGIMIITIAAFLHHNEKTYNYLLAYFYIFGLGYYALKLFLYKKTTINRLFDVNTAAVLTTAAFAVTEVFLHKYLNLDIQEYIPRFFPHNSMYSPGWPRAYALATEPGILAHYFNTLGPLALWQLWRYRFLSAILKSGLTLLVITAWLFTFSAAGFAFMFVGVVVVVLIRLIDEFRRMGFSPCSLTYEKPVRVVGSAISPKKAAPGIILLGLVVLFVFLVFWNSKYSLSFQEASEPVHTKISLRDSSSVSDRLSRWETALAGIAEKPIFGNGIGCLGSRQEGSSTSWFLFLALESGIPATILFVLFLAFSFRRIWKSQQPYRYWFLAGFLASVLHFNVVSTIHHPFLWVLLALFHVAENQKNLPTHNKRNHPQNSCLTA